MSAENGAPDAGAHKSGAGIVGTGERGAPDGGAARGVVLALDASTYTGTVAILFPDGRSVERSATMRGADEERLMPEVARAFDEAGIRPRDLARVVCGAGPGSFTSLRIAAAIAKGVAFAADVELWAASSLALIVAGAGTATPPGRYLAAIDAMRGEAYTRLVDVAADGTLGAAGEPSRLPIAELGRAADDARATLIGPVSGAAAAPHARGVARLIAGPLLAPVDLSRWEPDYGRLAEAQVRWEAQHGRVLGAAR